ncbi:MAG: metallophosphoesterase [Myxococcales bacterium]|nr:metallophosphoesterase [Myxococcales bacterium]
MRVERALHAARAAGAGPWHRAPTDGRERTRRYAVGDPQAPLETFLRILDKNGLLAEDGSLAPDVALVSIGDHFDWGTPSERPAAQADGLALLAWLAAHPEDQVTLIAGNHDLARVGELFDLDDTTFQLVHTQALAAYRDGSPDPELERALCEDNPWLATAELAARDLSAFSVAQRELVATLLESGRLRLAYAPDNCLLFCHAGVTRAHLDAVGLSAAEQTDARIVAARLNDCLSRAVRGAAGAALSIEHLHRPGSYSGGEGGGVLYHRPGNPDLPRNGSRDFATLLGRRFDPRRLPLGLTQVIGHIADQKCRELLGPWALGPAAAPGEPRHLVTDGREVRYRAGLPETLATADQASLLFIDGHMNRTPPEHYQLLEW